MDKLLKHLQEAWKELEEGHIKHNSKGEQIADNTEVLESFWSWFGNSVMVDGEGNPLVCYHTTSHEFDEFDVGRGSGVAGTGIYLTTMQFSDDRYGDRHLELYVSCENPLDLSDGDKMINEHAKKMGLVGLFELHTIPQMRQWSKDFREGMLKMGYDGCFVMPQGGRTGERHLVVYNKNQVKLVGNNSYTNSNKIREAWKLLRESEVDTSVLEKIKEVIEGIGGEIYVVGGPIRDAVRGLTPKDIDFLVRHLELEEIQSAIDRLGKAVEVGKSFGIVTGRIEGEDYDFAIPRVGEEKVGAGHTDVIAKTNKSAPLSQDLGRRDFTWNAMVVPLGKFIEFFELSKEERSSAFKNWLEENPSYDPYGGLDDLDRGVLRTVGDPGERFKDDALRMLRAIQFSVRMGVDMDEGTALSIQNNLDLLTSISGERILMEFKKAWTKANSTHQFIELLSGLGVGEKLFGGEFNPLGIDLTKFRNDDEKVLAGFLTFFLRGGDYTRIKPSKAMADVLTAGELLMETNEYPQFNKFQRIKEAGYFDLLLNCFKQLNKSRYTLLLKMQKNPMGGKELSVTGKDLQQMGITGSEIGITIESLLRKIWDGKIENNFNSIKKEIEDENNF